MSPQVTLEDLNEVLRQSPFLAGQGFEAVVCSPGRCELRVAFDAARLRPGGRISGMTIMGAADVAVWLAIMTVRGTRETWVTVDMKTSFLRGAGAESLTSSATLLSHDSRMACGVVRTEGVASGVVAHHVVHYAASRSAST
jgi:acyl-coenzyme A thioesterase PaaI-like protein